jgi:hypothetical protein
MVKHSGCAYNALGMKVRWTESSLRLRITPTELARLSEHQAISARLAVGEINAWEVRVEPGAEITTLSFSAPSVLTLNIATADIHRLSDAQTEGIYFSQDNFRYFLEKDFPCVHPRPPEATETTETFAPPEGFAERHKTC